MIIENEALKDMRELAENIRTFCKKYNCEDYLRISVINRCVSLENSKSKEVHISYFSNGGE